MRVAASVMSSAASAAESAFFGERLPHHSPADAVCLEQFGERHAVGGARATA